MGNCSLWSWIVIPTWAICVISPDSEGIPSMTRSGRFSFNSWSGIWWWWAKSWSINAMPIAPQSISACVGISWLLMVNVQVITKCLPSIDSSNTSTFPTDKREIPKHCKASKTKLLPPTEEPSFTNWPNLFLIPLNVPQFLLPSPPLQLGWTSELFTSPCILPPSGQTHHSVNTSHPRCSLPIPPHKSFFGLHWDPEALVQYIRQLSRPVPL